LRDFRDFLGDQGMLGNLGRIRTGTITSVHAMSDDE
jgi:hypothetical protein